MKITLDDAEAWYRGEDAARRVSAHEAATFYRGETERLKAVILSGWGPRPEHLARAERAEAALSMARKEIEVLKAAKVLEDIHALGENHAK